MAFVAGNMCMPKPATGMTAFKLIIISSTLKWLTNYSF
ncbi:hypothetical protein T636_A2994 [Enterobacter hormaechei subsp. xiangfangensis]|nr:hypothetical protein T636_A2994 [Enterobacter hormaechei subsp. xiangfangensis]